MGSSATWLMPLASVAGALGSGGSPDGRAAAAAALADAAASKGEAGMPLAPASAGPFLPGSCSETRRRVTPAPLGPLRCAPLSAADAARPRLEVTECQRLVKARLARCRRRWRWRERCRETIQ